VHEFISAGVAGFFLEDQVFPKRCGYTKGVGVISISEAVAKYRAAVAERDRLGPDVVVIARTDTRSAAVSTRFCVVAKPISAPGSTC
jgi:2-methylisocitrate lyase-like PEP mutase family enzyme